MKSNTLWLTIVAFLLVVIGVLSWIIFGTTPRVDAPASTATTTPPIIAPEPSATTTTATPTPEPPLSARVTVDTPMEGETVGKSFTVAGQAPGNWYFEASFPIQVRDAEGTVIGRAVAQAQSDWMTTALVPFSATTTLMTDYHGPATLILMRDNPSGLPEHDDAVSVPITIR